MNPIVRSGYATTPPRNGSTSAWRKARAHILATATHCGICHQPLNPDDPIDIDHITPHAYGGNNHPTNLQATHRTCNRRKAALHNMTTQGGVSSR